MKLLFIENRYKTHFFDLVAAELEKLGHEIFWIIQNPNFLPKTGNINIIKYPSKKTKIKPNIDLSEIIESDRQLNFFKKKEISYFYYYYEKIESLIREINPEITFGESTVFHELLTIKIVKDRGGMFLHPTSCRYPSGRFSFYKFDTVQPFRGSNDLLLQSEAKNIIKNIVDRSSKPDYMKKVTINRKHIYSDKIKILKGYFSGEKYNTPHPFVKLKKEKEKKKNITIWNKHAIHAIDDDFFSIVYPLHLQPEANIDVWGRNRRNQLENVKGIAKNLKDNQTLYVKPNPKSKYEISQRLIDFIKLTPNVKMLHHDVAMDAIFNDTDLFLTVNGTIALECIFTNKPVLSLVNVFFNNASNCVFLENFISLQKYILKIQNHTFPSLLDNEKVIFLNLLCKTSFKGVVSDFINNPICMSNQNIKEVTKAFNHILKQ